MTTKLQYGSFIKEMCCEDCDYAGGEQKMGYGQPMPISICPDCGGKLEEYIGRWMYTEIPAPWYSRWFAGFCTETIYHGFQKGRAVDEIKNLSQGQDCDCEGCKICDSGQGYQPCHNGKELGKPP